MLSWKLGVNIYFWSRYISGIALTHLREERYRGQAGVTWLDNRTSEYLTVDQLSYQHKQHNSDVLQIYST